MRNRYLDLLRAIAIVRVVVYHSTGWVALTIAFPAMSVMFALAGSLMAATLDRCGPLAVERRLRRLLPSLWAMSVIAVPAMLLTGLAWDWKVLYWAFPIQDPPANGWGSMALSATWYLRDFLWFVLLSPLVLPVFRRFPRLSIAVPYLALVVITFLGLTPHAIVRDMALYGGAWLLGFAHHDGMLRRLARRHLVGLAAALGTLGAAWILTHPGPRGYDLNDIPLGNALWSAAFILVALGFAPVATAARSSRLITVLNARALTIYLWHVPIIVAVTTIGERHGLPVRGAVGIGWRFVVIVALVAVAVLLVGWVEDFAAGRRPVLVPGGRPRRPVDAPVSPAVARLPVGETVHS
ncbi:acyltransferase family protein [Actinoplanes friuliensis]|uniref:Putative O-acetyltransferase n=1 Tax=Actinoplanes friuliensis DSM 7358 TaxID=1246995 RepID=U5VVY5_9ACTN|nr:acyltransferase [Actinoplanes friuliensis]AGZ39885.1 Putative O-acetyltransferase [Actinoplanes friuliensis DSM 7358]